ncbi:hypothetical protein GQ53DRAFT_308939 [Thozetella sp. PMI_491]|nr:hypothetical protein GQ53DRAFT_308939 [Thozetella sp. PMI_491]
MSAPTAPSGGFSLFPNTSTRPPSRNQSRSQRPRATTPSSIREAQPAIEMTPPRVGRHSSVRRTESVRDGKQRQQSSQERSGSSMGHRIPSFDRREDEVAVAVPLAVADVPPRCETAFSEARTLVRSSSNRSRSSIAKPPIQYNEPGPSTSEEPGLRSIFPLYNHQLTLDRQDYYPTQASPTHIPRGAISRPLYSPSFAEPVRSPLRSPPMSAPMSAGLGRWPNRTQDTPTVPQTSTTEQLKGLWKVTNGWRATPSEGQMYCLKMTAEPDAPIYTLSSDTQPFYNIRLDPTSTSAYVSMFRHDPARAYKGVDPPNTSALAARRSTGGKHAKDWQEVLSTTLEEESRRRPPNDGLVALLYPTLAAKMALERPDDMTTVALAEHEAGRLVWDADSGNHFLVHPALAMPFCVTVERNPAWSRTEYTLEHIESPQYLARLTRDGTGVGWLEVDTGIASKIDSVYLIDVAIAALMLVAHTDDKFTRVELFEPPPVLGSPSGSVLSRGDKRSSRASRASRRESKREEQMMRKKEKKAAKRSRMEEFEIDLESQSSEMGKTKLKDKDPTEGLPGPARVLVKLLTWGFKFAVWCATIVFKTLAAVVSGLGRCCLGDKL